MERILTSNLVKIEFSCPLEKLLKLSTENLLQPSDNIYTPHIQ